MWQGFYEFLVNQWGVGHGGFHSQSIRFQSLDRNPTTLVGSGSLFRVIYDCGSGRGRLPRQALFDAIDRMLYDVDEESTIDLLVISHFDRDHINGLDHLAGELARRRIRVARVWAPLLTEIEALFAIATSDLTGAARESYAALVGDPAGRLADLFAGADVTQIEPSDDPIPLPSRVERAIDEDVRSGADIILTAYANGPGLIARPGVPAATEALWEFQPYVIRSTLIGASAVHATIHRLLGKRIEHCSLSDLINLANNPTLVAQFHSAVLAHHRQQPNAGARQSSARTGPNLSTLCLYSGPVSPYDWCHFRRGWAPLSVAPYAIPIAPAWLGTGDAGLSGANHVDAMRTAFTQSRLDRVGITSAPHHGSRHDSGGSLWDALPNVRQVTIEANHATGGTRNRHPHAQVLSELATRSLTVHACTDGADFCWRDKRIR